MPVSTQILMVPDVGSGVGPWPSGWIAGALSSVSSLGLAVGTTEADLVILLGSATGTEPIDETNPNQLATFCGGTGLERASVQGVSACAFYAMLRYPPPAGTQDLPRIPPTAGATLEMQGT